MAVPSYFPFRKVSSEPKKVRLLLFPFAGGSAVAYRGWEEVFPSSVDVCAFELRGRGTRLDETPLREMEAMLLDVEAALVGLLI